MDSVEESLRGLLAHSVPRPGPEPGPATSAEFGQLLSQAALAGPDAPLDYRLDAPKWQFLCHAADHGGYVLHGSGTDDIAEFEPRQSNDIEEFGNRRAVYAASDGLGRCTSRSSTATANPPSMCRPSNIQHITSKMRSRRRIGARAAALLYIMCIIGTKGERVPRAAVLSRDSHHVV